ncbi:hypothetical protein [Nocardioides ferulae]|uniref:hypothetical protein n=1 Tax=Nocardioides ferulae TaxID=2340821 RepID=UPI000EB32878|nr:hypothetical protein [Nocardioides ferulae]
MDQTQLPERPFIGARPLRFTSAQRWAIAAGLGLAALAVLAYLTGWALADDLQRPRRWGGHYSDRDEWGWDMKPRATLVAALGGLLAWVGLASRFVAIHPQLRRVVCAVGVVLLGLVAAGFAVLGYAVLNASCGENDFLCFSGPGDALLVGSPGLLAAAVAAVMVAGLMLGERRSGRVLSTVGVLAVTAPLPLVATGVLVDRILAPF